MQERAILWLFLQLHLAHQASSGVSPYNSAAHYWPLDQATGIYDVKTNSTAIILGPKANINFAGSDDQFLYKEGNTWIDLGDFKGTCLSEPAQCKGPLTVSLWLRYSGQDTYRKQVFLATTSKFRPRGFVIYSELGIKTKDVVVVKVNTLNREWLGSLQLASNVWHHVLFTWSNSTGLSVYKNAELMSSALSGRVAYHPTVTSQPNPREAHLSLSSSNDGRKKTKSDCSYDDIAVWYSSLSSSDRESLLRQKAGPPKRLTCNRSSTWLEVTWERPDPSYDVLRGFDVWLSDPDKNERKVASVMGTSYNSTNLTPDSTYKFRVQNKLINSKVGRSRDITCTTSPSTLGIPTNLTVEVKSISAILLRWGPPKKAADFLAGYKVVFGVLGSESPNKTLDVGSLELFLLTKLLADRVYVIQVVAYGDGYMRDSDPAEVIARTDKNDALSVSNVELKASGVRAIRVSWTPPRDKYKRFTYTVLLAWEEGPQQKMSLLYQGNATAYEHNMTRLDRPHSFLVIARVVDEIPAVPITASPVNISVVSLSWSSVSLAWDPPPVRPWFVDSYQVVVASGRDTRVLTSAEPYVHVDRLKQLTNYWVNVQAGNKAGYGPPLHSFLQFKTRDRDECRDGSSGCHEHAACTNTEGSFFCKCKEGYVGNGIKCEESDQSVTCPKETSFGVAWSETLVGETDITSCPPGTTGSASRLCVGSLTGDPPAWVLPDFTRCVSRWLSDAVQQLDDPNVNTTSLARTLADLTDVKSNQPLYAGDLRLIVDVIDMLSRGMASNGSAGSQPMSGAFVEALVSTSSNVLDPKNLNSWNHMPEDSKVSQVESLIDSLDVIALEMGKSGHLNATDAPNVVMKVASLDSVTKNKGLVMSDGEAAADGKARFPASILRGMPVNYATLVSFKTLGSLLEPGYIRAKGRAGSKTVGSALVSLSLHPPRKAPFQDPVVIVLRHDSSNQKRAPECMFLNTTKARPEWSDEGCHVAQSNASHTTCYCYHLTSFAVLMSIKENAVTSLSESHRIALSVISYVGVSISVVALCLAFFTFSFFKFLKSFRVFIHKNLAISLILAQLVFLFGIDKTGYRIVCQAISVALHYFFLVAFCWMALEGVILYLMLVKVFRTKSTTTKTKILFSLVGWGSPAAIVSTAGVVNVEGYGTEAYCWLSLDEGFIWWFVAPVLIIIAFNFVCLGITFSVMAKKGNSRQKSRSRQIRYWAKACTLLTCILGLTWMFGVMYINHETLFMAYFFTIFNSLQGLFIFLFHCLGDEKVRQEYARLLCCKAHGDYLLTKPSDSSSKTDSQSKSKRASGASFKARFAQAQSSTASSSASGTPDYKKHLYVVQSDGHIQLRPVEHNGMESSMYSEAHDSDSSKQSDDSCHGSGDEMCETNFTKE